MNKFKNLFIFSLIIILATATRFYKLGEAPAGLYLDEAAQGYNAYSIWLTGKDEFGKHFPIVFRSFTDFKTPVYIYLVTPLIPIFGLTKFAVRFPSFLFSILTLPFLYLLIHKISSKKIAQPLAFVTSLLLAISPWHILFGRTNFECNVALFFFIAGAYYFYLSLEKPKYFVLTAILWGLAIPSYHSQRIVTPLMMLTLALRHRRKLLENKYRKPILIGLAVGFLISLPTLFVATTPGFLARASGLNIFSREPVGVITNTSLLDFLVNNKLYLNLREFFALYLSYFSPRNMFILGDYGPRSSFPYLSTFFIWQAPFYVWGFYKFIKAKNLSELKFYTLSLLLIAPIPAAVTRDPYSTIRALPLVIPQLIIISFGMVSVYKTLKNNLAKQFSLFVFGLVIIYSLLKIYSSVIILNEYYRAPWWNYGWEQVATSINKTDQNLPVVIDNSRTEPHSQLIFFLKYDPVAYQKDNGVNLDTYYTDMNRDKNKNIGRIQTRPISWEDDLGIEQIIVGDHLAISKQQIAEHNLELLDEILYPDGSVAFRVVKTSPKQDYNQTKRNQAN